MTILKSIIPFLLLFSINSNAVAADNSVATIGDLKEAVYKLIMKSKRDSEIIAKIGYDTKDITGNITRDKYDNFIAQYVNKNKLVLDSVK